MEPIPFSQEDVESMTSNLKVVFCAWPFTTFWFLFLLSYDIVLFIDTIRSL